VLLLGEHQSNPSSARRLSMRALRSKLLVLVLFAAE
jgi:hypothetical protein